MNPMRDTLYPLTAMLATAALELGLAYLIGGFIS